MTSRERIEADVKAALKAGEKVKLATVRLLLAAIKNEQIRIGEEVDEPAFLGLVRKAIKQRRESAEQYRKGEREDLATREEEEAEVLAAYLPPAVDDGEIEAAIRELIVAEGLAGPAAMGRVMKVMLERFAGRADGGTISRTARGLLAETG